MFVNIDGSAIIASKSYDAWLILPYLLIIICALLGINVIGVLGIGIGTACVVGISNGLFTLPVMLQSLQKGMGWMQDLVAIALILGGIVALMKAYGGIAWLVSNITKRINSKKGSEYGIAALVSALNIAISNNTIAIVSIGPIAKELGEQYQIDPRRTASLLDIFSCGIQGLVPYGGQLLAAASLAGVSPLALTPYCWYPMLILVFGILAIATGLPKFKDKSIDDFN
ncbi:MAG: Na+/H+ antiporter NhaC [Glaciecola sp.]|jgi:Na+/H+ antiporter NhaC